MKAVIVCGGSISDYQYLHRYFANAGLIISVDGGARHLRNFEVIPDMLIGDFDSISDEDYNMFVDKDVEIIGFPIEKDMTDSELAIELAVKKGCKDITLLGATGTRLDHTLANVFLLKKMLDKGVGGKLVDEYNEIELIDKYIPLEKAEGIKVSLLPVFGKVTGVTTEGLYYPLSNATLEPGTTWGISNEFLEEKASVKIKEGLLLIIKSKD